VDKSAYDAKIGNLTWNGILRDLRAALGSLRVIAPENAVLILDGICRLCARANERIAPQAAPCS